MSMWGRAAAGFGGAVADIANKYIDNDVATQRAQAIADIQRASGMQQLQDADAFRNDPTRVSRDRANKVADITAEGTARSSVELAGKKAAALDPELLAADVERAGKVSGATASASAEATRKSQTAQLSDPAYIAGEANLAEVRAKAAHKYESSATLAAAELSRFQLKQAQQLSDLHDTLATAITTGDKGLEEQTRDQINALSGKDGKTTEFYKVAESAAKVMGPAQKILADSLSSPEAKEDAKQTIREQRALMVSAAKRAGVDLTDAAKEPEADVHAKAAAAIKAGADPAAVNKKLAAAGYAELPVAAKKPGFFERANAAPAEEQPPSYLNDAAKRQWILDKPARDQAALEEKLKRRRAEGQSLVDSARGATISPGD
jgi:hypothetical protein